MNRFLLNPEVQEFIREARPAESQTVALGKSPFPEVTSAELARQIHSRDRIRKKLPSWHACPRIYYPDSLALEQCSSERTAACKSRLIAKDLKIIDLTGGFGVDSLYLSRQSKQLTYCESQPGLFEIARHNLTLLNPGHIDFRNTDGMKFLLNQSPDAFDFAYLDPSRRQEGRKVFNFQASEPDIIHYQQDLLDRVRICMIKAAPFLDFHMAMTQLHSVSDLYIISVENEVKELLFLLQRNFRGNTRIHATRLLADQDQTFTFYPEEEKTVEATCGKLGEFLYEPDAALMKAGCFKLIGERLCCKKLHLNTHLYTSNHQIHEFPGKTFKVVDTMSFKSFKKQPPIKAASIVSRNFPVKADALRRRFRIQEDPQNFLFFYRDSAQQLAVSYTIRIK